MRKSVPLKANTVNYMENEILWILGIELVFWEIFPGWFFYFCLHFFQLFHKDNVELCCTGESSFGTCNMHKAESLILLIPSTISSCVLHLMPSVVAIASNMRFHELLNYEAFSAHFMRN